MDRLGEIGADTREVSVVGRQLWMALSAGPLPWRDGRSFTGSESLALGATAFSATTVGAVFTIAARTSRDRYLAALGCVGLLLLFGPEVWVGLASRACPRFLERTRPLARPTGLAVALASFAAVLGPATILTFAPFGIDSAVTMNVIGIPDSLLRRVLRSFRNPFVVGIGAGLAAASVVIHPAPPLALFVGLGIGTGLTMTGAMCGIVRAWMATNALRERDALARQRQLDARYFASWLHDQISNPVRLLRLRLADGSLADEALVAELDQLEVKLRQGQVDHLVESGIARLRDVASPFLRVAERLGVEITDVPDAETANLHLKTLDARLASRAIGVLVNNALQAGARTISLRAEHKDHMLTISVEDDAGGFIALPVHAGRGLSDLRDDLNGGLDITPTIGGSLARATIALS